MKNKQYNGHPSWEHWNASLWVCNDFDLYQLFTTLPLDDLLGMFDGYTTGDGCTFTPELITYAFNSANEE
jgi:hypothetical protein